MQIVTAEEFRLEHPVAFTAEYAKAHPDEVAERAKLQKQRQDAQGDWLDKLNFTLGNAPTWTWIAGGIVVLGILAARWNKR